MKEITLRTETHVQDVFDWNATFIETQELVKEDAELTATIDDAMVRRFQGRVKIGLNLIALQEAHSKHRHGDFTTTTLLELGMDKQFAYRCIRVAKLYQNSIVPRVVQLNDFNLPLPMNTWNELASSSTPQAIIEQIVSGEIESTPQAIKKALEDAKKGLKKAEEDKQKLQGEFDFFKGQAEREREKERVEKQKEIELLKMQKEFQDSQQKKLEGDIERIKLEKKETIQEDTPATKAKLQELEKKLKEAEYQQKKLKDERDEKEARLKQKSERVEVLTKEIQDYALIDKQEKHNEQIRTKWRQACDLFHQGINQGSARMVTPIDAQQAFESDDWARLAEVEATLRQTLDKLTSLRNSMARQFVESSMDYVEA